jgi:hypothetical protein
MSQSVRSTYDEPLWTVDVFGEWKLAIYEDYAMFIDLHEQQVAEIVFKIDWE